MIINRWPWLILYNYVESQLELYDIITEFKVVNIQIMTLDQIDKIDIVAPLNKWWAEGQKWLLNLACFALLAQAPPQVKMII